MTWPSEKILQTLDQCAENNNFPMLDNGYVYLATTRMSLFFSKEDWGLSIEVFGFSPRSGLPDLHIYNFSSNLHHRDEASDYSSPEAYENYLKNHPNDEFRFFYPINNDNWINREDPEFINDQGVCNLRGRTIFLPPIETYQELGISLENERPQVFEFCRYLAAIEREAILATEEERRVSILPSMEQILQIEEWYHPDLVEEEFPSQTETFQQISNVLETGDVSKYQPTLEPNTHWKNWPEGGTL